MKKLLFIYVLSTALFVSNINAFSLGDVAQQASNSFLGKLDSKFNNLFSASLQLVNACLGTSYGLGFDITDPCQFVSNLNFRKNVCGSVNTGINGFDSLCRAKQRQFNDYVATQGVNFVEWAFTQDDTLQSVRGNLPNGSTISNFNRVWDVNSIMQKAQNSPMINYLKTGRMKELTLVMDYAKTNGAQSNPADINIDNIKAPADLNSYATSVQETILNQKKIIKTASPSGSAGLARSKLKNDKDNDMKDLLKEMKADYDNAKITEIGNTLAVSDYKKIAIPTQEYVNLLRSDLRPQAIAQIRKQQAYEVAIATQIEEKWNRRFVIAQLLIDKEKILAQEFDEDTAKQEVEKIANGSN